MEYSGLVRTKCPSCRAESLRPGAAVYDPTPYPRCRRPFSAEYPIPFGLLDWELCDSPALLRQALELLGRYPSLRKDRLLACAVCVRAYPEDHDPLLRRAVATGVAVADGRCPAWFRREVEAALIQLPADRSEIPEWLAAAWYCVAEKSQGLRAEHRPTCPAVVADCYREVFPNPFAPRADWADREGARAARAAVSISGKGRYDGLPALAGALEAAGCVEERVLDHCRSAGPHVPGCWVIDQLLGQE